MGCLGMWRRLNRWGTHEFYSILLVYLGYCNKIPQILGGETTDVYFLKVLEADCLAEPWGRDAV